ncbi:MAG: recombinase family protein [Chloroflexota bacterium]
MARKGGKRLLVPSIALCYIRQSFTRDESDTNSPERQRANIQLVCEREGWTPEWYVDAEGHKSGRNETNRPAWLQLKERLHDADVVALVANDMSRIHRKAWRVGRLVDEILTPNDIRLVLAAPGREIDTSVPMGRLLLMMIAMQDESYANDIAQRAKDSIAYRKRQGKSVGIPPFGTIRDADGFLIPMTDGAWLLPNGRFVAGLADDAPPEAGAIWRGYYDCARRILELYAENSMGRNKIAYRLNEEGWAFRNRHNQPRPMNADDVRRVTSNWREYAGLVGYGRSKDQNASVIENPVEALEEDTGRAVFDMTLLHQVAQVQEHRSRVTRPRGSIQAAHPYALARLLYCAHCETRAIEQENPQLRSRLSGHNRYGTLRYRHAGGVSCGCKARSVLIERVEGEFRRLVDQLTLSPEAYEQLVELAIQSEHHDAETDEQVSLDEQRNAAIAKCRRRMEAARQVYMDGDISRDEYLSIKERNEREIIHWQNRSSDTQRMAIELQMCMNVFNQMIEVWDSSSDEDRQNMAHMLFEHVIYDLDAQHIVGFRLKVWAERYLVLRSCLFDDDSSGDGTPPAGENEERCFLKDSTVSCPQRASTPYVSQPRKPNLRRAETSPAAVPEPSS